LQSPEGEDSSRERELRRPDRGAEYGGKIPVELFFAADQADQCAEGDYA
jgi:hypothetical protein